MSGSVGFYLHLMVCLQFLLISCTSGRHIFPQTLTYRDDISKLDTLNRSIWRSDSRESCGEQPADKVFDCFPDPGANEERCRARGCCWQPRMNYVDVPFCFYPPDYPAYELRDVLENKTNHFVHRIVKPSASLRWPNDILNLQVEVSGISSRVVRLRITDALDKRWEPPIPLNLNPLQKKHSKEEVNYDISATTKPYGVKVTRTSDKLEIFQSSVLGGPLIFSDQFIQISTIVPSKRVYGIGEQRLSFMHDLNRWIQIALYSHDVPPYPNVNLYGVHNFMLGMTDSGKSYGIYFLNSNAQEVILQPTPAVTYRTIGGIIDLFIFTAENPADVVSDYWTLIGPPMIPPYWSLGFHLCRYGYKSTEDIRNIFMRNYKLNMPQDVQWSDIDYMNRFIDWTVDPNHYADFGEFVTELKTKYNKRYVVIVDPGISTEYPGKYEPYDDGLQLGIFINKSDNSGPIIGKVWPGFTVFPDFTNPKITGWWAKHMKIFYDKVEFSGLWIDMNEPSNFIEGSTEGCTGNSLDNPPYTPGIEYGSLNHATLCASARQSGGVMYNLHNLYGHFEAIVTRDAMKMVLPQDERLFILSRSTFSGTGRYTFHWTGDNLADWDNLYFSFVQVMNFNLYGIPMVGADICGFRQNSNEELCTRWMQAGTFYPFMRNHNDLVSIDQDPAAWSALAQNRIRETLRLRYSLLPYLYTQLFHATTKQTTVIHPLFFHYPNLVELHDVDTQFMMGPGLMIAPILSSGVSSREIFFPEGYWCHLHLLNHERYAKGVYQVPVTMDNIPVYIRGGHVISFQGWKDVAPLNVTTTKEYRQLPFTFIACIDDYGLAGGDVVLDDGITYNSVNGSEIYNWMNITIDINNGMARFQAPLKNLPQEQSQQEVNDILILGVSPKPRWVTVNGKGWSDFSFYGENLRIFLGGIPLWKEDIILQWSY
jgi:lysosomal alpha-glucosidase